MSTAFVNLSREGKFAKLEQHLGSGHPVPSSWVRWVVSEYVPANASPSAPGKIDKAFDDLDDANKLEKLAGHLDEGVVPGPWVEWLLGEYAPARAAPEVKETGVRP